MGLLELVKVTLAFIAVIAVFGQVFTPGPTKPLTLELLSETYDELVTSLRDIPENYDEILISLTDSPEAYDDLVRSLMTSIGIGADPGDGKAGGAQSGGMKKAIAPEAPVPAASTVASTTASGSPAPAVPSAAPSVTQAPTTPPRPAALSINVAGGGVHKAGETLHLYGENTVSDTVYLFVNGLGAPIAGGNLSDLRKPVIDQRPETFTAVKVRPDGSWQYDWTPPVDPKVMTFRIFNVIAGAGPRDSYHLGVSTKWAMASVKIETA